ncbi:MAG TPA: BamA/TamA family outer membrane protein [Candidatus Babeliales bacterium]|nr:BamA/TamA family outer membrane protein [Candidatus Babeliales bacterium]
MNQSLACHLIIIMSFFCFGLVNAQQENNRIPFTVMSHDYIDKEVIKNILISPTILTNLSFESDVILQEQEFLYLMGFDKGCVINSEDIIAAIGRFAKKNKYSMIQMTMVIDDHGISVHLIFKAAWIFKKIKIHNMYQRKQSLLQLYLMERGDNFDQSKHDHSLTKIKDYLISNGYFNQNISSFFEYNHYTKEVIVHISIKKGQQFYFGTHIVEIKSDNAIYEDNDKLCKLVQKKLSRDLSSSVFIQEQLHNEIIIMKNYLAKKGFLHTTIDSEHTIDYVHSVVNVCWKVTIHQKKEIVFFGHRFFSKRQLFDKILVFGQSTWLLPASLLAEEIVRAYKSKGFLNAEVITQEEKERSFFIIKEGPRAIITAIEIKNGTYGHQDVIKKKCFGELLKHSYFDTYLYDKAINLLTNFYFNQGFPAFTVIHHDVVEKNEKNEYALVVTVDEGGQKQIKTVSVNGHSEFNEYDPFKKIIIEGNIPFTNKVIDEQRAFLVAHFQSLGYLYPKITLAIESLNSDVSLRWSVDSGEKIRFGKTIMSGSSSIPFSCVKPFLCYKEGELWDQTKIKQTFTALKELEIFETIHFSADGSYAHENRSILLKLHPDDRYEIRTRAGLELQHVRKYQTFSGLTYKIGGTTLIKNPSNCADQIRFDCDFARSHREIVGCYRRPWFMKYPFFTTLQIYSIIYDQPGFIGSDNDLYTLVQNGFFLGIQKKSKHFNIDCNNGFEWMKIHIKDNVQQLSFARAIDFKPQLIDKLVPFVFIEPTLMIEWLDDLLYPTRGGLFLFSLKGMIPVKKKYKDSSFFKLLCEQSLFIPLKTVVAALRFRCGHIFYREFSAIMPSERFYLGGSHSLRGYEADLAPPLGIFVDEENNEHIVPRGGRSMVNANIELRLPLYKKKIGAVLFQDLGALSGTLFADFKRQDVLAATGFGLRIFTPLGPLRFDIGWKWRKQIPVERSFAWFLTFGQAF